MKRISLLLLVCLALAMAACAQNLQFNNAYDAPLFSAMYAKEGGTVTPGAKELDSKVGKLTQNTYIQEFDKGNGALLVQYMDLPADSTFDLDAGIDGMLAKFSAQETKPRSNATLGRLTARAAAGKGVMGEGASASNVVVYMRDAKDGNRTWAVIFLCLKDNPCSEADANTFFNSVKIK